MITAAETVLISLQTEQTAENAVIHVLQVKCVLKESVSYHVRMVLRTAEETVLNSIQTEQTAENADWSVILEKSV